MNNNKKINLQFTELTLDDVGTHENLYIEILANDSCIRNKHTLGKKYYSLYHNYAINELQKANDLFLKTFS